VQLVPRIALCFPLQPWNPGDPVIRDGMAQVLGPCIDAMTAYGGDEAWRDRDLAFKLMEQHDALLLAGTPAYWDPNDRDIVEAALAHDRPIIVWGIGTGGGDDLWEGLRQEPELLRRFATHDRLQALIMRDETTHRVFRHAGAGHGQVLPCPGLFALGEPRQRQDKQRVALDLLDPATIEKDGLFDAWRYYTAMRWLAEGLQDAGASVTLSCQRALHARPGQPDHPLLRPETWHDREGRGLAEWLETCGFPQAMCRSVRDFSDAAAMRAHFDAHDVHIGGRVHGVLPAAGHGMAALGMGIDLRRHTWLPAAEALDIVPHAPPCLDVEAALNWYSRLDIAAASARAIALRGEAWRRTRGALATTLLAPLLGDTTGAPSPAARMAQAVAHAWQGHAHGAILSPGRIPRPPPIALPGLLLRSAHSRLPRALRESQQANWAASLGAALAPHRILDLAIAHSDAGLEVLLGAPAGVTYCTIEPDPARWDAARRLGATEAGHSGPDDAEFDLIVLPPAERLASLVGQAMAWRSRLSRRGWLWLEGDGRPNLRQAMPLLAGMFGPQAPCLLREAWLPFGLLQPPSPAAPEARLVEALPVGLRLPALAACVEQRLRRLSPGEAPDALFRGLVDQVDGGGLLAMLYQAIERHGGDMVAAAEHLGYAAARLPDEPLPPGVPAPHAIADPFPPGSPAHHAMRREAALNLLALLSRAPG